MGPKLRKPAWAAGEVLSKFIKVLIPFSGSEQNYVHCSRWKRMYNRPWPMAKENQLKAIVPYSGKSVIKNKKIGTKISTPQRGTVKVLA